MISSVVAIAYAESVLFTRSPYATDTAVVARPRVVVSYAVHTRSATRTPVYAVQPMITSIQSIDQSTEPMDSCVPNVEMEFLVVK